MALHLAVEFGVWFLFFCLPLCVMCRSKPSRLWLKIFLAVLLPWVLSVFYMALIYNPVNIAYYQNLGGQVAHDAQFRYDNNTVAAAIMGGWFWPSCVVAVYFVGRRFLRRYFT